MRIVSLLPAATELIGALGLRGLLVGRSHECDFPEDVRTVGEVPSAPLGFERGYILFHTV